MIFFVDIKLETDTCLAGGRTQGTGDVDISTELDDEGMPLLRGRTLKGLLVEEAAEILSILGCTQFEMAAASMFGEPGHHSSSALLSFEDGSVPSEIRNAFMQHKWPTTVLTTLRYQTAIDEQTGAAQKTSLRTVRLIRAGIVLRCRVHSKRPLHGQEKALFAACVESLHRMGLHRNEGWGRVTCSLRDEQGVDITGNWLAELDNPLPGQDHITTPHNSPNGASKSTSVQNTTRIAVEVDLLLEKPAIFADRAAGDWVVRTFPYIPGSAILGASVARYLSMFQKTDPSADVQFQRLFLSGEVRWLNAYPKDGQRRPLPTPCCWRFDEDGSKNNDCPQILDLAHPEGEEIESGSAPGNWKPSSKWPFAWTGKERVRLIAPKKMTRLHHQRDRELGRSLNGEMFVYEALESGLTFQAVVLCESESDADMVQHLLKNETLAIGRSRTATYGGGAQVTNIRVIAGTTWKELNTPVSQDNYLLLSSDYLGRNKQGTADPAALLDDLAFALDLDRETLENSPRFLAHRTVHGHVGRWQMPRPTQTAVAAGSVFVLRDMKIDPQKLAELHWKGLGERRAEGFGRVVLVACGDDAVLQSDSAQTPSGVVHVPSFADDCQLMESIHRWVGITSLRPVLLHNGAALGSNLRYAPTSLIARVRQVVRTAQSLQEVEQFVRKIHGKKAGRALAHVVNGQSFEEGVLSFCRDWITNFPRPQGITDSDLQPTIWMLQQHWLDAVLERWRREAQKRESR